MQEAYFKRHFSSCGAFCTSREREFKIQLCKSRNLDESAVYFELKEILPNPCKENEQIWHVKINSLLITPMFRIRTFKICDLLLRIFIVYTV